MLPAGGGAFFLPRLLGIDRALLVSWTGDMIDAREAERIGLVTMVVPHDELPMATRELAERLAKGPALAIQKTKRAIYESLGQDLKTHLEYVAARRAELLRSEDHKEGATSFVEKRAPYFKGR
jgi:enoyl-CoA hydratase/carnithine racemase